jgi:hypothetical protein
MSKENKELGACQASPATALSSPSAIEPTASSRPDGLQSAGAWTPGPWAAEDVSRGAANERPWVGRLVEGRYAALASGETQVEAIANARLIAAAPDLYEALAAFVAGADAGYVSVEVDQAARAALAKATGNA